MEGSIYNLTKTRLTQPKNLGYNYNGNILIRNTSPIIYSNPVVRGFGAKLEKMIGLWFRATKLLRTSMNPAVDKDTNYIN